MSSSSIPGGSTPVSSANMMSGWLIGNSLFRKLRRKLLFLVSVPSLCLSCKMVDMDRCENIDVNCVGARGQPQM